MTNNNTLLHSVEGQRDFLYAIIDNLDSVEWSLISLDKMITDYEVPSELLIPIIKNLQQLLKKEIGTLRAFNS